MKNTKYLAFALVLAACGTPKNTTTTSTDNKTTNKTDIQPEPVNTEQTYVDQMKGKYADYTLSQYQEGKNMFEMHCGKCHDLPQPTHYTEEQWTKIVPGMTKAVNKKEQLISALQQESLLRNVVTMTSVAKK